MTSGGDLWEPYAVVPPLPTNPITTYTYGYTDSEWGDLLTSYRGQSITYDEIGNPLSYYNGTRYTFTWTGRQLTGAVKGSNTYSFTYNDEGIRTSKTVNGVTTTYYLNGSQILGEETNGNVTVYVYDESGLPIGMQYHASTYAEDVWDIYWYEKNLQGDIVAVYAQDGTKVISYKYDAWETCTTSTYVSGTAASNNPFKYRGYYYDKDLGLYYLNTRYYDAAVKRFINADDIDVISATPTALTDKNLYAYCDNNPVMRRDDGGQFWDTVFDVVSLGFSIADVVNDPSDPWAWAGLIGDAVDLIPFVSGVGEITKGLKFVDKAFEAADNLNDARKASDRALESIRIAAKNLDEGTNYVYISRGADGIIDYVGITNDFARREAEWAAKGRKIYHYIDNLDRNSARIVEQTVIETFGIGKKGGILDNRINSISVKNKLYKAVEAFKETIGW